MTWTAAGSLIYQLGGVSSLPPFSLTPVATGDLIIIQVITRSATVWATALSSSNVTWATAGTKFTGTNQPFTEVTFFGTVTAASAANVTLTLNGTDPGHTLLDGWEFASSIGKWALDTQGDIDVASPGQLAFPSLTPAGAGELYFAFGFYPGSASAGSTSGFTFTVDPDGDGVVYNTACTTGAQSPVWGGTAAANGSTIALGVLVKEVPTASGGLLAGTFP